MRSDRTLLRLYRLVNKKFFDNTLPHDTCVRYLSEREQEKFEEKYFGWTSHLKDTNQEDGYHTYCIVISKSKNPGRTAIAATLVHEMVHVATEMRDDHGPAFEAWRQTIADRGIFKKGAVLKGLTLF